MNRLVKSLAVAGLMLHLQSPSAAPVGVPAKAVQNYLAPCFTAGNGVNCEVSGVARVAKISSLLMTRKCLGLAVLQFLQWHLMIIVSSARLLSRGNGAAQGRQV